MELTRWETEQGAALHSAAFGGKLFVTLCGMSSQEGVLSKHCIPACRSGISPLPLGIKSWPRGESGCFFADWCAGWSCGGSTRQSWSLFRRWNSERKWRIKSAGTGSKMCLYWKTSFMGSGLQGKELWVCMPASHTLQHSVAVLWKSENSFHQWRILRFFFGFVLLNLKWKHPRFTQTQTFSVI